MDFRNKKMLTAAALFAVFAVTQIYIGVGFAGTKGGSAPVVRPQQLMGILSTRDNQAIMVNGVNTISGASIPSGATIETPAGVGATINIGGLGSVCLAPNTKVIIQFDETGKKGSINVVLVSGCMILTTNQDVKGQVKTAQAVTPTTGGTIDVCMPAGQAAVINQGAAATAGAGASGLGCFPPAGAAAIPPTGDWINAAIAGGVGVAAACIIFCNPSPSSP